MGCPVGHEDDLIALRHREIAFRTYDGETFIRSLETDCPMRYHVIPGFGSDLFVALAERPRSVGELRRLAAELTETPVEQLRDDLDSFVDTLHQLRLASVNGSVSYVLPKHEVAKPEPGAFNACEYMYDYAYRNLVPFKVDVELTYRCNLDCQHCYASKDTGGELTFAEISDLLTALAELGCLELVFTGGECTLRPDFLEIVAAAKKAGFAITILTNGTRIDAGLADELARLLPEFISISFYGARASTHDAFTRVPGSFDRTLSSAEMLTQRGIRTLCTYVLNRQNVEDRTDFRALVEGKGMEWKSTALLFPKESRDPAPLVHRVTDEQLVEIIRDGTFIPTRTICTTGRGRYRVSPQGDVFPCELMRIPLGNIRQAPLREILEDSMAADFRRHSLDGPQECQDCDLKPHCPRCAGIVYLETGTFDQKFEEGCRIAAAYRRALNCKT